MTEYTVCPECDNEGDQVTENVVACITDGCEVLDFANSPEKRVLNRLEDVQE